MTKKRFKLSMAALGLLAAFFMVLIAVLLAPTLASANKDGGKHHDGMPGSGHPIGGPGGPGGAHGSPAGDGWNAFGHQHGNAHDTPFCVEGGVYPCAILDDPDAFDGGNPDNFESGYPGGGAQGGEGSPNDNGHYTNNYWSGGAPGGGAGGGGSGSGVGDGGNKAGSDESGDKAGDKSSDEPEDKTGDKTGDSDPEIPLLALTPPEDEKPNEFVDPNFGGGDDDQPKTEGGPEDENTPVTEISVTEVPEPLTLWLFAVGLAGAASLRRRSREA